MTSSVLPLIACIGLVTLISFLLTPKVQTADGVFRAFTDEDNSPTLRTLVLSQVTTWIFARSLMTAAILGFYYGIAGALAYAAYYLSFLTGGRIIGHLRFKTAKAIFRTL